jgi:glycosyltransferase involved in cell wall biosynthesis
MNNQYPKVSLIVSTYNRPDALNLCLQSIVRQSLLPGEVIIGDDGSKEETRDLIESFRKNFPVPLIHVWQEDKGFRLAMCRNKAVAASHYEYIIEIDGDLILHRDFVADHLYFSKKGYFLKGGRVNLTEKFTNHCCNEGKLPLLNLFSKGLLRRINALHCLPLSRYFSARYKKNRIAGLGCNMSFWKEDYIQINGYDEFFEGWGGEDYDFASRMVNSGVKRLYLKFSGIVYHLWHNDLYMQNKEKNFRYYHDKHDKKAIWAEKGIDQYLKHE